MTARRGRGYRYGRWHGGPDPLAAPYDLGNAVDEIGDSVLGGSGVREALRELLRRGTEGRRGLDELRRSVRERLRRARTAGRMDGTLQEVRELLDQALSAERRELFPDPDDSARLAEAELDALPDDTAGAVRALKESSERDLAIAGPSLAASAFRAGLVDELQLVVAPAIVGAGTASLPDGVRVDLELVEERRFDGGMAFLRYRTR